jgi:hypothetical protein
VFAGLPDHEVARDGVAVLHIGGVGAGHGSPVWTENDFQELLRTLGYAGFGWLRPDGVRRQLTRMTRHWQGSTMLGG